MQYSPLCETNVLAYLAYVAASRDGAVFDTIGGDVGGGRVEVGGVGSSGVGGALGALFRGAFTDEGMQFLGRVASGVGHGGVGVDRAIDGVPEQFVRFSTFGGSVVGGVGSVCGSEDHVVVGDPGVLHKEKVKGCAKDTVRVPTAEVLGEVAVEGMSGKHGSGVGLKVSGEKVSPLVVEGVKKKKRGKNQRDREKYRQEIGAASWRKTDVVEVEKSDLRVSLEKKWAAQNELAAEKARKDLEYQKARDVDAEARKSRARLMKETESSKVATEKAFAFLKSTGNVVGFCETVVSASPGLNDGSSPVGSVPGCTISPDSSASMHEFREAQKKIADLEFQNKKLLRRLEIGKLNAGEEATFTVHSDGEVSDDVKEAIANNKTDFFDVDTNDDGFEDEKPRTLYAKRVAIPGADEYLYDNY